MLRALGADITTAWRALPGAEAAGGRILWAWGTAREAKSFWDLSTSKEPPETRLVRPERLPMIKLSDVKVRVQYRIRVATA